MAFREIENEYEVPVRRQVAISNILVDGIFRFRDNTVIVEIKFFQTSKFSTYQFKSTIKRFEKINYSSKLDVSFLFILVVKNMNKKQNKILKEKLEKETGKSDLTINIRIFDYSNLMRKYGLSNS